MTLENRKIKNKNMGEISPFSVFVILVKKKPIMSWSDEGLMNVFTETLNANNSVTTFKKFCIFIVICADF